MRGLKYVLTSITPPRKLAHVTYTLEKGRKGEVVEKVILEEKIFI
jgi:hypothetical protein